MNVEYTRTKLKVESYERDKLKRMLLAYKLYIQML